MISMRHALAQSGLGTTRPFSVLRDLKMRPQSGSLRTILRSLAWPRLEEWVKHEKEYANKVWTEECQGVAVTGGDWYFTSNNDDAPGVHRVSLPDGKRRSWKRIPRATAGHVGALDVYDGLLYVALEEPPRVAIFDRALTPRGGFPVDPPTGDLPWCAVCPWNGLLYTSGFDAPSHLLAFDRFSGARRLTDDIPLPVRVNRVQGGCFSLNGKVYLSSDDKGGQPGIYVFSLANGRLCGRVPVAVNHSKLAAEEIEGVALGTASPFQTTTHIHLVLLNNDWPDKDNVYFKSWEVPDPTVV